MKKGKLRMLVVIGIVLFIIAAAAVFMYATKKGGDNKGKDLKKLLANYRASSPDAKLKIWKDLSPTERKSFFDMLSPDDKTILGTLQLLEKYKTSSIPDKLSIWKKMSPTERKSFLDNMSVDAKNFLTKILHQDGNDKGGDLKKLLSKYRASSPDAKLAIWNDLLSPTERKSFFDMLSTADQNILKQILQQEARKKIEDAKRDDEARKKAIDTSFIY